MGDKNTNSLKEVISDFLKAYGLKDKLIETRLLNSWEKICGRMISKHTQELHFKKGILIVTLDSAALKSELHFQRQTFIQKINRELGEIAIKEIVFK